MGTLRTFCEVHLFLINFLFKLFIINYIYNFLKKVHVQLGITHFQHPSKSKTKNPTTSSTTFPIQTQRLVQLQTQRHLQLQIQFCLLPRLKAQSCLQSQTQRRIQLKSNINSNCKKYNDFRGTQKQFISLLRL